MDINFSVLITLYFDKRQPEFSFCKEEERVVVAMIFDHSVGDGIFVSN
jgi:hypothetical protein